MVARRSGGGLARVIAVLLAASLVAAACGGDDDGEAAPPGEGTESTDGGEEEAGEPVRGGTLVYGIDSDSANPWAGYRTSCATSCFVVLQSVADPLFLPDPDLQQVGYLAESAEPNEDYTQWTFTIRDGITFHDGTPLDGEAVKFNIETCIGSALTGVAYTNIESVEAEGQTVTLTTAQSPWVALPSYFSGSQCSYMMSPTWLRSLPDVPHRQEGNPFYDAELAATPADGDPAAPVGTGPFVFESYTPGNGNAFRATRNDGYWRGDGPDSVTGEGLPYLDAIEAVVAVDVDSRSNALRSGQFDIMHTANADTVSRFIDDDEFQTESTSDFAETNYIMLNLASGTNIMTGAEMDPEGANADSPLLVLPCRKALAHAIDLERLSAERGGGITTPANGPFPPGSIGHLEDTGYPQFDLEAAETEMEACLSELGSDTVEFTFNTTNDPFNVESNALIISMWEEAFGDVVRSTITPIEQGQYIGLALTGNFEAFGWRNHGGMDPDQQLTWWISAAAAPIGELAINFGRFNDPVIDENLITIRTNPDPDARREAAEAINRQFGEQVYNWWLSWAVWGVMSAPYVNDVTVNELPDGSEGIGFGFAGRHQLPQVWCDDGTCE